MEISSISTNKNDHHKLEDLPSLVCYHILKYLDLKDLNSLKLVSKRFYFLAKNHKITELSFINFEYLRFIGNWYSTTRSRKLGNQIHVSRLRLLCDKFPYILLNLKYLRIRSLRNHPIQLSDLNKFNELQILELREINMSSNNLLRLHNLKSLSIDFYGDSKIEFDLVIDTPALQNLRIYKPLYDMHLNAINDRIKFDHPLSVKHLYLNYHNAYMPSAFKNLESLELLNLNEHASILETYLLAFKNLKNLKINCYLRPDGLKEFYRSKKDALEMVLAGVKIQEINQLNEYNGCFRLKFQMANYDDLEDDLHFVHQMNYSYLIKLRNDLPSDFFSKYNNIQEIYIRSEIEDEARLIDFIKKCNNAFKLDIQETALSSQFFDQLTTISSITELYVFGKDINFEFVMKMSNLISLITDQDVLTNENLNLNNSKRLKYLKFKINNYKRTFKIRKTIDEKYLVDDFNVYFTHDGLFKWCARLRNKKKK